MTKTTLRFKGIAFFKDKPFARCWFGNEDLADLFAQEMKDAGATEIQTYKDNELDYPVWEVSFTPGVGWGYYFLALGANEQEAIDEVIDYCEKHFPGLLLEYEREDELRRDALKDGHDENEYLDELATFGGNHGRYLDTSYGIWIEQVL